MAGSPPSLVRPLIVVQPATPHLSRSQLLTNDLVQCSLLENLFGDLRMPASETAWEFRRRRAVELHEEGEQAKNIARYLGVCTASVHRWVKLSRDGMAIDPQPSGGRPRRISPEQIEILRDKLAEGATAHGWPNEIWTTTRVCEMIQRHFGIRYSRQHTWYVLHNYLGWTSQRPTTRLRERDEAKIQKWPTVQFKRILREAERLNAYIAFADECGFMLMPTIRKTYSPRGQRPILKTADPHGRISTACAITISPKSQRANIYFQMLRDNANYNGRSISRFLRLLSDRVNAPILMVWDCIPIHLAKPVRALLRERRNIRLRMLPKYAPELNPADKVWAYVKYARLANYAPSDLDQLRDVVKSELHSLKRKTDLLHSFVKRAGLDLKALKKAK